MTHKKILILAAIPLTILLLSSAISYSAISSTTHDFIIKSAAAQNKTSTSVATIDYRVYNNPTLGIKMEVPSDWLDKEINNTAVNFVTEKTHPISYKASVVVSIENVPKDMSLDMFTKGNLKDVQQSTPFLHIITSNSTTLSSSPAHQIVFTSKPTTAASDLRQGMEIWTLKNGKAYVVAYRAGPGVDKFPILLPVVKHMIDSFQITK